MISKKFLPIINRPIRVTPHSRILIDNIFCYRVEEVESSIVITTNISDHYPVLSREKFPTMHLKKKEKNYSWLILNFQAENSISVNCRVFTDENLSNFKNSLQDTNWTPVLINDDAAEAYDLFQSILLTVFNEHFPIQTKNIYNCGKSKPWISSGIRAAICLQAHELCAKKARQNRERFLIRISQAQKLTDESNLNCQRAVLS